VLEDSVVGWSLARVFVIFITGIERLRFFAGYEGARVGTIGREGHSFCTSLGFVLIGDSLLTDLKFETTSIWGVWLYYCIWMFEWKRERKEMRRRVSIVRKRELLFSLHNSILFMINRERVGWPLWPLIHFVTYLHLSQKTECTWCESEIISLFQKKTQNKQVIDEKVPMKKSHSVVSIDYVFRLSLLAVDFSIDSIHFWCVQWNYKRIPVDRN
jgi:hypothetical protein